MKTCVRCKQEFPETKEYFNKDSHNKDGLYSRCRKCHNKKLVRETLPEGYKRCTGCKELFLATSEFFYSDKRAEDGLYPCCKSCFLDRSHASYYKDIERSRAASLASFYKHHESRLVSGKRYRDEDPQRWLDKNRRWGNANIESRRAITLRRVARRANAEGTHTAQDILDLYELQNGLCAYCGIRLFKDYHVDHVTPLFLGGSDNPDNLVCSCVRCNSSKGHKLVADWQAVRGW